MKLGVLTALYADRPLEAVLDIARSAGLDCVEIGAGNPLHPRAEVAAISHKVYWRAVLLAEKLEVPVAISSAAVPETRRAPGTRTGSLAPGQTTSRRSWRGSGKRG